MRKLSLISFLAAAVLLSAFSCAKTESEDTTYLENMAFDAWMKKYVIDEGIPAVKQENGMYVHIIDEGDQNSDASYDTIVWLKMNYTATDLHRNVFVTRNEEEALKQGTFTPYTYYASDFLFCGKENHNMITGQFFALKNKLVKPDETKVKLGVGAKVRMYMPSYLAFGSSGYSDAQGYGGQYNLTGTKPVIEYMEVVEVVKDPVIREEKLVDDFAQNDWGLAITDTIVTLLYVDTLNFRTDLSLAWDKKYALTADSTAKIWFVGKFLDGFIFDTNIDSVFNNFYNRKAYEGYYSKGDNYKDLRSDMVGVMKYKPESNKDTELPFWYKAIPKLRRGQWSRLVFASGHGYGATGLSAALKEQTDYYNYYMNYLYSSSYGYGGSYYGNNYYNSYYNTGYGYGNSFYDTSTSTEGEIITEIQPYTPLVYEIYIEAEEEE